MFADRNHYRALTSPLAVRHARAYVLNNWRKHHQDQDVDSRFGDVDRFSSAVSFGGRKELEGRQAWRSLAATDERLRAPTGESSQTWLLATGWQTHGLISTREVPGPKAARLVA